MRIVLHGERRLMDVGLDAVRDVLDIARDPGSHTRPWTKGWRGTAMIEDGEIVVEASKRSSTGRRRVRVVAGPEAFPQDRDAAETPVEDRLAQLLALFEGVEPVSASEDDEERSRPRRLMAAFGIDPPVPDWESAVARPGSSYRPPVVDVRTSDDEVVRLSPTPRPEERKLLEAAVDVLRDDGLHVDVFESGRDVFVRMGAPPRFRVEPGNGMDVLRARMQDRP